MGVMFRLHLITSIIFALNYEARSNQYELGAINRKLESSDNLDRDEISPSKYKDTSEKVTHNSSCPIHSKPLDCAEVFENGFKSSGVYKIFPRNKIIPCGEIKVYCDMETDGGGWTVIQRRGNFNRTPDYFYNTWQEYKAGFGNLEEEFWLGNDNIYALTNQKKYSARFDLGTDNDTAYATYDKFWIENEELKYKLYVTDYSGTAGHSMGAHHHTMPFSTKDRHNNRGNPDCANERKGGWWYRSCAGANLNGLHLKESDGKESDGIYWVDWKGYEILTTVEIKIRPLAFQKK